MSYDVAVVGTGADPDTPDRNGFAMAYHHASAYQRLDDCRLVACADIVKENAVAFADYHDISRDDVFEDYERMLRSADPDVISVCVPPAVHADIVCGSAETEVPAAIHCEKPMATTWADCRRMVSVCDRHDIQLTINHQRRLGPTYREAKRLLDGGKIGSLHRIEWSSKNLFDSGTHLFDLSDFYVDGATPEWVLGGLDYTEENQWFGTHNSNQGIAQWQYENGVYGTATTGRGADALGCHVRLVGTEGVVEIGSDHGPPLRYRNGRTLGWKTVHTGENVWGDTALRPARLVVARAARALPGLPDDLFEQPSHIDLAIESVVRALQEGTEPALAARNALRSTELVFAAWESVRRRGRVDLPLDVADNPLESMVETGQVPVGLTSN